MVGPLRLARKLSAVIPGLARGESPEPMNATLLERMSRAILARRVFMGSGFAFGDPE